MFEMHFSEDGSGACLAGELDLATAPAFQQQLEALQDVTMLDCRELTFIDSSGLRALLIVTRGRDADHQLVLRGTTPRVRRVLELSGLTAVLRLED